MQRNAVDENRREVNIHCDTLLNAASGDFGVSLSSCGTKLKHLTFTWVTGVPLKLCHQLQNIQLQRVW